MWFELARIGVQLDFPAHSRRCLIVYLLMRAEETFLALLKPQRIPRTTQPPRLRQESRTWDYCFYFCFCLAKWTAHYEPHPKFHEDRNNLGSLKLKSLLL